MNWAFVGGGSAFITPPLWVRLFYDEWCPARGVVVVVNVRGTRGDHLLSAAAFVLFCWSMSYEAT